MFKKTTEPHVAVYPPPSPKDTSNPLKQDVYGSIQEINESVKNSSAWLVPFRQQVGKTIIGQTHLIERLLVGLLTGGHVLLEGLPGLAKTLAVKTLSQAI